MPCPLHSEIATDRQPVAPTLPTAELAGSRRLPEHAREPTREWAQEEPLTASKVARTRDQGYPLNESTHRDLKPSMARVSHVGADHTACDFSSMRVTPRDTSCVDIGTELGEALSGEVIEIELQSLLKANSVARARHCCTRQLWSEPSCRGPARKKCRAREGGRSSLPTRRKWGSGTRPYSCPATKGDAQADLRRLDLACANKVIDPYRLLGARQKFARSFFRQPLLEV